MSISIFLPEILITLDFAISLLQLPKDCFAPLGTNFSCLVGGLWVNNNRLVSFAVLLDSFPRFLQ